MTEKEALDIIGNRVTELSKNKQVQDKMIAIANIEGKEKAVQFIYNLAIATLCK